MNHDDRIPVPADPGLAEPGPVGPGPADTGVADAAPGGPGAAGPTPAGARATDHDLASPAAAQPRYLQMPLGQFLGEMAARRAAPGGGAAAATCVALAASLCAMTARYSGRQLTEPRAAACADTADEFARQAAALAEADADSFEQVLAAWRQPADEAGAETLRRQAISAALSEASDVPMAIVTLAAEVAGLAAELAAHGNPNLRGDAATAGFLAQAGAASAAALLRINLAGLPDDRPALAAEFLEWIAGTVRAADPPR
ncbi:MAG: cyclodeaminase/cyclohydrolase family protein [Streptosporangiaceae bacterium]